MVSEFRGSEDEDVQFRRVNILTSDSVVQTPQP